MNHSNKVSLFIILGIFFSVISLGSSIWSLNTSYSSSVVADEVHDILKLEIDNLTDIYQDDENIRIIKNPKLDNYEINYGVELLNVNSVSQFQFNLNNKGNVSILITDINIEGVDNYKDYIEINLDGLKVGDIIEPSEIIKKINVYTRYNNSYYDEEGNLKTIILDQIKITIEFESLKRGESYE